MTVSPNQIIIIIIFIIIIIIIIIKCSIVTNLFEMKNYKLQFICFAIFHLIHSAIKTIDEQYCFYPNELNKVNNANKLLMPSV